MDNIEHDELIGILERINGWIENCDSKVSTILGGIGVIAGILLATDYISKFISIFRFMCQIESVWSIIYLIISVGSICSLLYGSFLLVMVLFARTDENEFESRGLKTESLIYFSSIAKIKSLSEYHEKLTGYKHEQMTNDLISQIYICSLICDKKFALYKKGLLYILIGFFVFMIMTIIGIATT